MRSLTFVLPSGTSMDTADPDADERFAAAEPELAAGLPRSATRSAPTPS